MPLPPVELEPQRGYWANLHELRNRHITSMRRIHPTECLPQNVFWELVRCSCSRALLFREVCDVLLHHHDESLHSQPQAPRPVPHPRIPVCRLVECVNPWHEVRLTLISVEAIGKCMNHVMRRQPRYQHLPLGIRERTQAALFFNLPGLCSPVLCGLLRIPSEEFRGPACCLRGPQPPQPLDLK
jgi:hypothetical protein